MKFPSWFELVCPKVLDVKTFNCFYGYCEHSNAYSGSMSASGVGGFHCCSSLGIWEPLLASLEYANEWYDTTVALGNRWHGAGTYDCKSKTGGPFGTIRNAEELAHGANAGLDIAVKLLQPIKDQFPIITYADFYQVPFFSNTVKCYLQCQVLLAGLYVNPSGCGDFSAMLEICLPGLWANSYVLINTNHCELMKSVRSNIDQ